MSTIRDVFHNLTLELNKISVMSDTIENAYLQLKNDPNNKEIDELILKNVESIKTATFKSKDMISKIKIPTYSLTDPDVGLDELQEIIRSKNKNITIHIVEDDDVTCKTLKQVLEKKGFEVTFTQNMTDAMAHIMKENPYIVILDLHVPGIVYGHELLEIISKESKGTQTIVLSTENDPKLLDKIEQYKPARILSKPINIANLEAALSFAVAKIVR